MRVLWLAPNAVHPPRGYWDQTILEDLLAGRVWSPAALGAVTHHTEPADVAGEPCVVVIPGAYQAERVDEINGILAKSPKVVVFITSDESGRFPWHDLSHPALRLWVQYGRANAISNPEVRMLPVGWSPATREVRNAYLGTKDLPWYFGGQVTHDRRRDCVKVLEARTDGGELLATPGFLKGLEPKDYLEQLSRAKVAPCPGGTHHPDTFRVYEALELGCVPLIDERSGSGKLSGYWHRLFNGDTPLPFVATWFDLSAMDTVLGEWPVPHNRVASWWIGYKRGLAMKLQRDVEWLRDGARVDEAGSRLSVLMPTSPIKSNPDTIIIDETLDSIRSRPELERSEIIIMMDGVRAKQEHYRANYELYQERLLRWARTTDNVFPRRFEEHSHQAQMTKFTLGDVDKVALLFVEHDTPLVDEIPVEKMIDCVLGGADLIRLHYEAQVLDVHQPLMIDRVSQDVGGLPLRRTAQWSQRPHFSSTGFYRRILEEEFDLPKEHWMIEDKMFGRVLEAWRKYGLAGWTRYQLYMYVPDGVIKRSTHTDGRAGDHKWTDE